MELAGDTGSADDTGNGSQITRQQSRDVRHNLQVMLQRQAKFLHNCRQLKVGVFFLTGWLK